MPPTHPIVTRVVSVSRRAATACAALTLAACATVAVRDTDREWAGSGRMLVDAPARFTIADAADRAAPPDRGCAPTLIDRRYGIVLTLVRTAPVASEMRRGDYRPSAPARYDVSDGELLRVECATGVPIGAVGGTVIATAPEPR